MKYQALAAALLAGALAMPAQAQDVSGFRIEARAGWDQVGAKATLPNPDFDEDDEGEDASPEFLTASGKDSSIGYGFELGYDLQVGSSVVVGAYAGMDFSDSGTCGELIEDDLACARLKRTMLAGLRAGVPIGASSLIYAKAGYSNGRFRTTYDADLTDNDDEEPGEIARYSESQGGFHVGGGLELGLTGGLYAKAEYVYTDFGNRGYLLDGGEGNDPLLTVAADRHQVFAGVGLRF